MYSYIYDCYTCTNIIKYVPDYNSKQILDKDIDKEHKL